MKPLKYIIAAAAFALCFTLPCFAQKSDEWWKMSKPKPQASPRQSGDEKLVWKPVKWSFPQPGMITLEQDGKKVYQLAKEVFAQKSEHYGHEIAFILFTPELLAMVKLARAQEPEKMPDVDKFLTAIAVLKAVETPEGYDNPYIGNGEMEGLRFYFYKTKSGANVGAAVTQKGRRILIIPAPSEQ